VQLNAPTFYRLRHCDIKGGSVAQLLLEEGLAASRLGGGQGWGTKAWFCGFAESCKDRSKVKVRALSLFDQEEELLNKGEH
jgi:hypothetical protein